MKKRSKKSNKKKNNYIIILIIIVVLICLGIAYYLYDKKMKEIEANRLKVTLKENQEVEINSDIKYDYFLDSVINGELLNGEDIVDTSKLGNINIELVFNNKDNTKEKYSLVAKVVDTKSPVIEGKKEISIYVGNNVNLLDGVSVTDNSKEDIKAEVVGEYDNKKTGKYNLKYVATDSSGNKTEFDFILNVNSDPNNRTFTTSKGYSGKVVNGVTYIDGVLIANKTYSLPSSYGSGLLPEMQNAFNKLSNAAKASGFNLYIGSGYRSYWDQKIIYNNYVSWDGQANADTYSARPGHSEHQTGLAADICDRNVSACITSTFDNTEPAKWINDNCYKYGLIVRYPKGKDNITGYIYESWHLRYVGVELATKLYNNGDWITLEEYYGIDSKYS